MARIARVPVNQLQMMKLLVNQSLYAQGLHATQLLGTVFDGIARHTRRATRSRQLAAREGFRPPCASATNPSGTTGDRDDRRSSSRPASGCCAPPAS